MTRPLSPLAAATWQGLRTLAGGVLFAGMMVLPWVLALMAGWVP